ncbi:MAG: hypothetical protein ACTS27_06260 [Phycisphaerales bacterium]
MPSTRLRIARFRSPVLRRPAMLGVAGGAIAAIALAFAAWERFAPDERFAEPRPDPVAAVPEMTKFGRGPASESALSIIASQNVLSSERRDFTREVAQADDQQPVDAGADERAKRLEDAKRDLQTLRLVAILRLRDDWVALFEPSARRSDEDLLSLRVGDVWQGWTIGSIARDTVTLGFEGHVEKVDLKPNTARTAKKAEPRGRLVVQSQPATGGRVTIDSPISRREARERLLGATRDESERVRRLAEELLEDLERENDR